MKSLASCRVMVAVAQFIRSLYPNLTVQFSEGIDEYSGLQMFDQIISVSCVCRPWHTASFEGFDHELCLTSCLSQRSNLAPITAFMVATALIERSDALNLGSEIPVDVVMLDHLQKALAGQTQETVRLRLQTVVDHFPQA